MIKADPPKLTGWRLVVSKGFLIPQRVVLGIMCLCAILNAYIVRVGLSIAITEMVARPNNTMELGSTHSDVDSCPFPDQASAEATLANPTDVFDWDEKVQGHILGSFFYGYIIAHLPSAILAEKFGGKHVLAASLFVSAICSFLTPVVARNANWIWICILRGIMGLGQGAVFPILSCLLAKWIPSNERGLMGTVIFSGSFVGSIVANAIGGFLIATTKQWSSVFYTFGAIGLLWNVLWELLCYSEPKMHPFISDKEAEYLSQELRSVSAKRPPTPWKKIFTSKPVWALISAQVGHDWIFYAMVIDLHKYMKDVLKFKVAETGIWNSTPYIFMLLAAILSGWISDWIVKKKYWSITFTRIFFTLLSAMVPGVCVVAASYAGCNRTPTIVLFNLAMLTMGPYICGFKVNAADLAPNYAGTLMAIVNGIGGICGIILPFLIGAMTPDHTLSQWRLVFWIMFAVLLITSVVFVIWASGEEQSWNKPERPEDTEMEVVQ